MKKQPIAVICHSAHETARMFGLHFAETLMRVGETATALAA